jgi:hypothetical protein
MGDAAWHLPSCFVVSAVHTCSLACSSFGVASRSLARPRFSAVVVTPLSSMAPLPVLCFLIDSPYVQAEFTQTLRVGNKVRLGLMVQAMRARTESLRSPAPCLARAADYGDSQITSSTYTTRDRLTGTRRTTSVQGSYNT